MPTIKPTMNYLFGALLIGATVILFCLREPSKPKSNIPQQTSAVTENGCTESGVTDRALLLMKPLPGPNIDAHAAMAFLFEGYDRNQEIAVWCPAKNAEVYRYLYHKNHHSDVQSKHAFSAYYNQNDGNYFIILFQTESYFNSCHACTVVLGGARFENKEGQWHLTALTRAIAAAGCYGTAPSDMSLVKVGPALYAVAVKDAYQQHGVHTESFLLISPVGDRMERVLLISESSGSNEGVCSDSDNGAFSLPKCYSYDAGVTFRKGCHPTYSDIKVTIKGTRFNNLDVFSPFETVTNYRFDGCRYTKGAGVNKGGQKPYYIQVAAFENYGSACHLVQELQNFDYPAYCDFYKPEKGQSIFRIRIGNYNLKGEADHILQKISQSGHRGFVSHK